MTKKLKQFIGWGLIGMLLVIFLSGCQAVITAQPQNTITAQHTPVVTPNVKVKETEKPSPLPTSEVTWTPLPTLSAVDAENRIHELLRDNGGCELPCWWGITPGESTWERSLHTISPLLSYIGDGVSHQYVKNNIKYHGENFDVLFPWSSEEMTGRINFELVDGVINIIRVSSVGTNIRYSIGKLLLMFGKPNKIWMEVDPDWNTFSFLLYYPNHGITAWYNQKAEQKDAFYRLCLEDAAPELWLWSPGKVFEYSEDGFIGPTFGFGSGGHEIYMQPIETIGLDIDTFVQIYGRSDPGCYLTPQSYWKVP